MRASLGSFVMTHVYLIADIGATNARFCLIKDQKKYNELLVLNSKEFGSASELIFSALNRFDVKQLSGAMLAVAGPLDENRQNAVITNTGHTFSAQTLEKELGCHVWLENDFVALAYGLDYCADFVQLGGMQNSIGVKGVMGPGSGLGMAIIVDEGKARRVFSSEGGHSNFAPGSHLESEIWAILSSELVHVSWENVLSGPGLVRLYRAMCQVWGTKPLDYDSEDITKFGVNLEEPVCHQTLETFFSLLGTAAGDFALTIGAKGGIYLSGGIVPAMSDFAVSSPLRRRFEEKGILSDYLKNIPLLIVKDDNPGLAGVRDRLEVHVD